MNTPTPHPGPPTRQNTGAVIVLYHPGPDVPQRIAQLKQTVSQVIVVDNTPRPNSNPSLLNSVIQGPGITYLSNPANLGIAKALNQGIAVAAQIGLSWLLMLDQDSTPPQSLLADLASLIQQAPDKDTLALIGINYQDASGKTAHPVVPGLTPAKAVITSGSLLRLDAVQHPNVGPFREDYFIDEVDHEHALRLRRAGFRVALASGVGMPHNLGNMRRATVLGRSIGISNHAPARRYYMTRNRIALAKTYLFFDPAFVLSRLALTEAESFVILFYEDQKASKLWHMVKGMLHGFTGRMGPL